MEVIRIEKEDLDTLLTSAQLSLHKLEDEDQAELLRIVAEIQKQTATAGATEDQPAQTT